MCMSSNSGLGKILNPIGAIAPKGMIGDILDPARIAGKKINPVFDPAGAVGGKYEQEPSDPYATQRRENQKVVARNAAIEQERKAATLFSNTQVQKAREDQGKTLLGT
jgi:hypothetical protein